jgi:hypothetical protein
MLLPCTPTAVKAHKPRCSVAHHTLTTNTIIYNPFSVALQAADHASSQISVPQPVHLNTALCPSGSSSRPPGSVAGGHGWGCRLVRR